MTKQAAQSKDMRKKQKSADGIVRVFGFITEVYGYIQIVLSPFLIGLIIGAIVYFTGPNTNRLIIGIIVAVAGLLVGIVWANKHWKEKGTIHFISRVMATPELDKSEEEINPKIGSNKDKDFLF